MQLHCLLIVPIKEYQDIYEDFASLVKELEVNSVGKKLINPHRLKARQPVTFRNFFQRLYYVILIRFLIPF